MGGAKLETGRDDMLVGVAGETDKGRGIVVWAWLTWRRGGLTRLVGGATQYLGLWAWLPCVGGVLCLWAWLLPGLLS